VPLSSGSFQVRIVLGHGRAEHAGVGRDDPPDVADPVALKGLDALLDDRAVADV